MDLTPVIFGCFIKETPMIVSLDFLSWAGQILPRRIFQAATWRISLAPSVLWDVSGEKGLEISIFTVIVLLSSSLHTLPYCVPGDSQFRYRVLSIPVNKCLILHQGGQGQLHSYVKWEKGSRILKSYFKGL